MLPLFPLSLIVFPSEQVNLHVFEPRYRQLIAESVEENRPFGITPYLEKKLQEFGTAVRVTQVVKRYEDGRMDISAEGTERYRLQRFINPMEGKLYAGGEVEPLESFPDDSTLSDRMLLNERIQELYEVLNVENKFDIEDSFLSYRVGHKVGLSQLQEYQLLQFDRESERLNYLNEHFDRVVPVVRETERTKQLIRLNGHFKNFDPLNF